MNRIPGIRYGCYIGLICFALGKGMINPAAAQIEMKTTGSHFQDFNSLSSAVGEHTWTDNRTIPGWYFQCPVPNAPLNYYSDDGTNKYVGKRAFGTNGDNDRALGSLCGKISVYEYGPFYFGVKLHNASSQTITSVSISYTGEQWRLSTYPSQQQITVQYRITADSTLMFTSTTGGSWSRLDNLNFVSPRVYMGHDTIALNGNDSKNRRIFTPFEIPGLSIPPGSYILLRWTDNLNSSYLNFGLAIDDVTVSWIVPESASSYVWTGSQSTDWFNAGNWSKAAVPGATSDVIVANVPNKAFCADNVTVKSLIIRNGGLLTLDSCKTLTVTGNATFEGADCLVLRSPRGLLQNLAGDHKATASLVCNGTIAGPGTIKVERFIDNWVSDTDGWHFFSSPVNNAAIPDQFKPGSVDDLYCYVEAEDSWKSQKNPGNGINAFTNGKGYLLSYQTEAIRAISGLPNNIDFLFTNLSFTGNRGWHLLGNPYPSGISWGGTAWGINGISNVAKLLNSGGTYSDLSEGEVIPAMNGFFIKVNAAQNGITIPKSARAHAISSGWKRQKDALPKKIKLIVSSNSDNTYAETKIIVNENATLGYDPNWDSPYLSGMYGAPLFYNILEGGRELSTNCVPERYPLQLNFEFSPGLAKDYTFKSEISEDWGKSATFTLEDLKTHQQHLLTNTTSFTFRSDSTDAPNRFKLVVDLISGIPKPLSPDLLKIFSINKQLMVTIPDRIQSAHLAIFDISGKLLFSRDVNGGTTAFTVQKAGYCLIQLTCEKGQLIKKYWVQ